MSAVHDSVDIVNAAANAITAAENRVQVQPSSTVRKRRWGNCLNLYWSCFGSHKQSKRVGHALIVSEPVVQNIATSHPVIVESSTSNRSSTTTIIFPFIAPPSSPASFLQSDPPSSTQTPNGPLSITSPVKTSQIYTIGPYAHETQLVSPPVFSTFTTEPSTACFTPPPETMQQMTSPSSPEVPFAQLLMSSLARNRRNNNGPYSYQKYSLSQCEFRPYYQYPSSPGSNIKSPGSVISTSGTCSPFPDKNPRFAFAGEEQLLSFSKWGSRIGSGALTPISGGISGLGSGSLTPNHIGDHVTGLCNNDSCNVLERQICEVASLANSDREQGNDDVIVDHRVSFELIGEDIPTCVIREAAPSREILSAGNTCEKNETSFEDNCSGRCSNEDALSEILGMTIEAEGEEFNRKNRTVSLGSSKDFDFSNANGEVSMDKSTVDCEWWRNEKVVVNKDW